MRILFDIVHPADVHFFRYAIKSLEASGHRVLITSRIKDITVKLLDGFSLAHTVVSRQGKGFFGLLFELVWRDFKLFMAARQFQPDILIANNSPSASHVGFILCRPSCVFDDTEINQYARLLYRPVAQEIHTPQSHQLKFSAKQLYYPGYHALAYLHPDLFTPNPDVPYSYGLKATTPYYIFRFVHWGASHDFGMPRISEHCKIELVKLASRYGRVVVSIEGSVPEALKSYMLPIQPIDIHHILAGASALIGESATMCAEAACLGVPSILIDSVGRGYTDEIQQRYGLITRYTPENYAGIINAIRRLLDGGIDKKAINQAHQCLIQENINVAHYQLTQIERLTTTHQDLS